MWYANYMGTDTYTRVTSLLLEVVRACDNDPEADELNDRVVAIAEGAYDRVQDIAADRFMD